MNKPITSHDFIKCVMNQSCGLQDQVVVLVVTTEYYHCNYSIGSVCRSRGGNHQKKIIVLH